MLPVTSWLKSCEREREGGREGGRSDVKGRRQAEWHVLRCDSP